jgi:predicted ester cyclase
MLAGAAGLLFVVTACGDGQNALAPVGQLSKPAGTAVSEGRVIVVATVTNDGTPVEGVELAFSRSIAGQSPDYRWSRTTDEKGEAVVEIAADPPASGLYLAKAKDPATGEVVGRWTSVPITGGQKLALSLPIGARVEVTGQTPLSPEALDNEAIARRWMELWNGGDLSIVDEIVAVDYINHSPFPQGSDREGTRSAVAAFNTMFDGHWTTHDLIVGGDKVVLRLTFEGSPAGEPGAPAESVVTNGIMILRVVDGKILERWGMTAQVTNPKFVWAN